MLSAVVPRSALHFLAAFSFASCSCASVSGPAFFTGIETHLPKAFAPFGWFTGAYFFLKAAMLSAVVPRSALHAFAAFFSADCPGADALAPGLSGLPLSAGGAAR